MSYFIELVISGAVAGSLYALVALAFVVIYKATRVVNFALGELVMFGTGFVTFGLHKLGLGLVGALGFGGLGMAGLAFAFNYGVLRFLIGRPLIAFIMVTIGFGMVLRAIAPFVFAGVSGKIELPFPDETIFIGDILVSPHELLVGVVAVIIIGLASWYFTRSRAGLAFQAISNDEFASMGMGINLPRYFAIIWALAGCIAMAAGVLWTYLTGGGVSLVLIALKVLPIVIIGGLESVPGALVGALILGIVESLTAGYIDPAFGAPVSGIVIYVLLLLALFVRPHGLFGRPEIRRV